VIITKQREWQRVLDDLASVGARSVFVVGCGECATAARTGGEPEVAEARERLSAAGFAVTGSTVPEVTCHAGGVKLEARKHAAAIDAADAIVVLACGAGTQTVADAVAKPVFPGLESAFLGTVVRHGVFEERCQMCGECVLDATGGICPVTTCPKGLLNGPCGGMWDGMCDVVRDRPCVHVQIRERLAQQGRDVARTLPPKDHSKKLKPAKLSVRASGSSGSAR
jgi:ferredoxin